MKKKILILMILLAFLFKMPLDEFLSMTDEEKGIFIHLVLNTYAANEECQRAAALFWVVKDGEIWFFGECCRETKKGEMRL